MKMMTYRIERISRDEHMFFMSLTIFDFTIFSFGLCLDSAKSYPFLLFLPTDRTIILPYPDLTVLPLTNTGDL
jgi:hypothetical protein